MKLESMCAMYLVIAIISQTKGNNQMWVRPKNLKLFSVYLVCVAVSFPIQIMFLYGHAIDETGAIFAKLSVLNWLVMISALLNAWLVFRASPSVIYTLPLGAFCVILNNWVVGMWHIDYSTSMAELSTLGYIGSHVLLFKRSIMDLVFQPEKRAWLHASRYRFRVTTFVSPFNGAAFK